MAPERVAVELRTSMDTIRYRWEHTSDWTARELGIIVHAEVVRIHPFVDGNGRSTRLLADLVLWRPRKANRPNSTTEKSTRQDTLACCATMTERVIFESWRRSYKSVSSRDDCICRPSGDVDLFVAANRDRGGKHPSRQPEFRALPGFANSPLTTKRAASVRLLFVKARRPSLSSWLAYQVGSPPRRFRRIALSCIA